MFNSRRVYTLCMCLLREHYASVNCLEVAEGFACALFLGMFESFGLVKSSI